MGNRRPNKAKIYSRSSEWEDEQFRPGGPFETWQQHTDVLMYIIPESKPKKYHPDGTSPKSFKKKKIYVELKGRFMDKAEYMKLIYSRSTLKKNEELVLYFMNPHQAMPGAQKRKDGTRRSHAEWAESEGFRWFCSANVQTLLDEVR